VCTNVAVKTRCSVSYATRANYEMAPNQSHQKKTAEWHL